MANTIKLKNASGSDPGASDLVVGEVAIRTDNGKLFTKKDNGTVAEITGGGGIDDGDKGDITVSNSGATFTIDNGVVNNAKISGSAAIAGTKIDPDFGSQNIDTGGNITSPVLVAQGASSSGDGIILVNSGGGQNNDKSRIRQDISDDSFIIENKSSGSYESFFKGNSNRGAELHYQGNKILDTLSGGVSVTGSITATGSIGCTSGSFSGLINAFGGILLGSNDTIKFDSDDTDTNHISFKGPTSLSSTVTYTLPEDGSANEVLKTDGSGVLSFGTIVNASVDASAAIAGTKISPDFGSQNIATTGTLSSASLTLSNNDLIINGTAPQISFVDSNANDDFLIKVNGGVFDIRDSTDDASRFSIASDGNISVGGTITSTFSGNLTGNVTGNASGSSGSCTGNAATATALETARNIGGVSFDGTGNINLPGVNTSGNQDTTGNAASADTIDVGADNNNASRMVTFVASSGAAKDLSVDGGLTYNPSSNTLTAGTFSGSGASLTSLNASNISSGTIAAARVATLNQNTTGNAASADTVDIAEANANQNYYPVFTETSGSAKTINIDGGLNITYNPSSNTLTAGTFSGSHSGNGSGLTSVDATTLDSIDSGSFLRSDADDETTGQISFSHTGANAVVIGNASGDNSAKLLIRGAASPYIQFRENNTNKAYIQWHSDGYFRFGNEEDSSQLRIQDDIKFSQDGSTFYKVWHAGNDGPGSGLNADTLDGIASADFLRSDSADTAAGDITFTGGAGAVTIGTNSDIRWTSGTSWTGNAYGKIQHHSNSFYIAGGSSSSYSFIFRYNASDQIYVTSGGTFYPASDSSSDLGQNGLRWANVYADTYYGDGSNLTGISGGLPTTGGELSGDLITHEVRPDGNNSRSLGTSSARWSNVFTNDLHLSNKGGANKIDNSWGDYTIQEGSDDLFLINNRNGKMYKFMLKEVS